MGRRALLGAAALSAGSALAGAGLDRLFADRSARRAAAEADRRLTEAVRNQADKDAQTALADEHEAALTAARDKAAALEEVKAQLPSGMDRAISAGFERLARSRPWLGSLRSSVGYFECFADGVTYRGAAELLDDQGTLVMCGHEFVVAHSGQPGLSVTFFLAGRAAVRLPIRMRYVDRSRDIAFATVEAPAPLRALGLTPVRWAQPRPDDEVVFVGFPEGIPRLHATRGAVRGPRLVETVNGDGSMVSHACKVESAGVTFSGMSGGGVFRDGAFAGMVNFSSAAGVAPFTYFTPAEAIRAAYGVLFAERARTAGLDRAIVGGVPGCGFDRAGFTAVDAPGARA